MEGRRGTGGGRVQRSRRNLPACKVAQVADTAWLRQVNSAPSPMLLLFLGHSRMCSRQCCTVLCACAHGLHSTRPHEHRRVYLLPAVQSRPCAQQQRLPHQQHHDVLLARDPVAALEHALPAGALRTTQGRGQRNSVVSSGGLQGEQLQGEQRRAQGSGALMMMRR